MDTVSRVRVFFNPLDAHSMVLHDIKPGTQVIEFLLEHYPGGFDGVLRCYVGNEEIPLDDLDYEVSAGDQITMLIMPGELTLTAVATALINAAIAAAISYAVSFLFAPNAPKNIGGAQNSPTYTIGPTQNAARLNEPIPVHYGTPVIVPDYASQPYTFFQQASDDQYADQLMVLGHGKFTIHEIYVGNTPVTDLEPGTVDWWVYDADQHNERIEVIGNDITQQVSDSANPFPFNENLYTSPEITRFEFSDDISEGEPTPQPFSGWAKAAEPDPGFYRPGAVSGFPDTQVIVPNDVVTLTGTTSNNVDIKVASVVDNADGTLKIFEADPFTISDEDPLAPTAAYTINTATADMTAGPYRAQREGQTIDRVHIDIEFPNGLMIVRDDGDQQPLFVDFRIVYEQLDPNTGNPIDSTVQLFTISGKQRNPRRVTIISPVLTEGVYQVRLTRETPFSDLGYWLETTLWTGLKGRVVNDTQARTYGPVTMLALRLKGTNGLSEQAQSRVRVRATRNLPSGTSSNPITIIKDIYTNTDYGMARPESELALSELDPLEVYWDGPDGPRFSGSFDQKGTGFDGMQAVAGLAAANVLQHNALTTVVPDGIQAVRTATFSTANMGQDSFEVVYSFDAEGDYDGIKIEYRDSNFDPAFVTYPAESVFPESINLFGCTDLTYAQQYAVYLWNVRQKRRKVVTFQTEMEGLIPRAFDRIAVSHPMPNWGQSGVLLEIIDTVTYRIDRPLSWGGGQKTVLLRDEDGTPMGPYNASRGETNDIIVLDTPPTNPAVGPLDQEPTHYIIADPKDFVITRATPQGELDVQIQAEVYDESIYVGGPPHMVGP